MEQRVAELEQEARDREAFFEGADHLIRSMWSDRQAATAELEQRARTIGKLEVALDAAEDREAAATARAAQAETEVLALRAELANARAIHVPAPADTGARDLPSALADTAPVDCSELMGVDDPTQPLYRIATLHEALGGAA
jgi:hypothetical protein